MAEVNLIDSLPLSYLRKAKIMASRIPNSNLIKVDFQEPYLRHAQNEDKSALLHDKFYHLWFDLENILEFLQIFT